MKKKLLFVMNNLHCGGAEKSLISLLETIDPNRFDIDLFLFKHEGMFLNKLPAYVRVLEEPPLYKYFDMSIRTAVSGCIRTGKWGLAVRRLRAGFIYRSKRNPSTSEQQAWKHVSAALPSLDKEYDAAVGFLEKSPVYFVIEKTKAKKKLGFIHNDYDKLGMDPAIDKDYFNQLDDLVTVSEECGKVLERRFPDLRSKVRVIHNIVSPEIIHKLSLEQADWGGDDSFSGIKIVSVGRLNHQKGFELAVEASRELVNRGYDIRWYIIGEGEQRDRLENMIEQYGLQGVVVLMGLRENPYPYLREADIYVQPSRFEGKAIAIDEAKIMRKPIVVTNFSTAKDQIQTGENGLIVDMNARALSEGIRQVIDEQNLRSTFHMNLSRENLGTEAEIEKLYELI